MSAATPPGGAVVPAALARGGHARRSGSPRVRRVVRAVALTYLGLLLVFPVVLVFVRTFERGLDPVIAALNRPAFGAALALTLLVTLIAVPLNAVMGMIMALTLVRRRFRGRAFLNAVIDLPFAMSPVVIGLALILVYGKFGLLGPTLEAQGIRVIFAVPGMVLATILVSLPFVVREVMPVLREVGTEQEEAAAMLGAGRFRTFRRITLPSIRWGVVYGVILTTARSLGEFGAVAIVSGKISGKTETLTLHVEERFQAFDPIGAYTASIVLALMALAVLLAMSLWQSGRLARRTRHADPGGPADEALR
ncbi:MAG: sulfate ABC transporter permease subunit [Chloroflexota bacterium]